jgi:hypothetical protein
VILWVKKKKQSTYTLKAQLLSPSCDTPRVHLIISSRIIFESRALRRRIMIIKLPHYHFCARGQHWPSLRNSQTWAILYTYDLRIYASVNLMRQQGRRKCHCAINYLRDDNNSRRGPAVDVLLRQRFALKKVNKQKGCGGTFP